MVTNLKKLERIKKIEIIGQGEPCPKCNELMQRRKHRIQPSQSWFYEKWDYCPACKHIQHYEEFKSNAWKESESRDNFFKEIKWNT